MNKYISKIAFVVLMSLGFTACSNDDIAGEQDVKVYHDENGNYVPITIEAGYGAYVAVDENGNQPLTRVVAGTTTGSTKIITKQYGKWNTDKSDKLIVIFDGKISELPCTSLSSATVARFSGRLYYSSSTFPTSETLYFYVKSDYLQVSASSPTAYTMLNVASQDGTLAEAMKHTVWYGTLALSSYKTSGMAVTLNPKTALLNLTLMGPLQATGLTYSDADLKIEGLGWGNDASLIQFKGLKMGNAEKQYCFCVNTKNTISSEKVVATKGGKIYERLIGDEVKNIKYTAGAVYNKPYDSDQGKLNDSPTLRIGDFLYSDGGWGDDPTPESGHKIIGIVTSKKSNFGTYDNQTSYHGTAMALSNANNNATVKYCNAAPSGYNGAHASLSASLNAFGKNQTAAMIANNATNWTAALAAQNYSSVPSGCSKWFMPSAAEWNDLLNLVGEAVSYSWTQTGSLTGYAWTNTEWKNSRCIDAINQKLNRVPTTSAVNLFVDTEDYWTSDATGLTTNQYIYCDLKANTAGTLIQMKSGTYTATKKVRPFIQF